MRPTLHTLQALRGVACLMVFGFHLAIWETHYGISRPLLTPLLWYGYAGVDLFFVLSGFLIAHTQAKALGNPAELPGYLFRRAWRIYPTYWVMMAFTVVLFEVAAAFPPAPPGTEASRWATWLTLCPPWEPNLVLPVAWTLCYEVLFYLAFGLLVVFPRRLAPWLLCGWAVLIGAVALTTGWQSVSSLPVVRHAVNPLVWEFLLGCAVAGLVGRGATRFGGWAVVAGIVWAGGWVLACSSAPMPYMFGNDPLPRAVAFGPAAALVVYGLVAMERRGGLNFPGWLRRTGDASYSIYLWHTPIGAVLHDWSAKWWDHKLLPHLGWLLAMTLVGVGGGFLLHRFVERPLLGLFARKPKAESPPVVLAARVTVELPERAEVSS